jgi:CRP/FNR family transcriptional regulator, cyclic AMP receptor protein
VIKLDPDQTFRTLAGIDFFKSFSDEEKKSLSEYSGQILTYRPKSTIIKQGMNENSIFFILKGLVDVNYEEQSTVVLAELGRGAILGEMSFICELPRAANAVAREETMVLRLEGVVYKRMKPDIQNKFKDKVIDILLERIETISNRLIKYL